MGYRTRDQHLPERAKPRSGGAAGATGESDGGESDAHLGYLIERRRSLALVCWRCGRRSILSPEAIAAAATRGPREEVGDFALRCRCGACEAKGPAYGYEGEPRPMLHGKSYSQRGNLP